MNNQSFESELWLFNLILGKQNYLFDRKQFIEMGLFKE